MAIPTISFSETDPTNAMSFTCEVHFVDSPMTIAQAQANLVTVTNGGANPWIRIDDYRFQRTIVPVVNSLVTVTVPLDLYTDSVGGGNPETSETIQHDITPPVPAISFSESDPTSAATFTCNIQFNGAISTIADAQANLVVITGVDAQSRSRIDDDEFQWTLTPTANALVSVTVPADLYADLAGNGNPETTETIQHDVTPPAPTIGFSESDPTNAATFTCTIQFNGAPGTIADAQANLVVITGVDAESRSRIDDDEFQWTLTPTANALVSVTVPADLYADAAGNGNPETTETIQHDVTPPVPVISFSESDPTNAATFTCTIQFSGAPGTIADAQASLVAIAGVDAESRSRIDDDEFQWTLTPTADALVSVTVPADLYTDAAGNGNPETTETIQHDVTPPAPVISFSVSDPTSAASFTCDAAFNNAGSPITQPQADSVAVTDGGSAPWTYVNDYLYQRTITPIPGATVTVSMPSGTYTDAAGNPNGATSETITHVIPIDYPVRTETNDQVLPIGRERMRYWAKLHVDVALTDPLVWTLENHSDVLELVDEPGLAANEKVLRTKHDGPDALAIPDGWAALSPLIVQVSADMGSQHGYAELTLTVQATAEDIDVAILLDRSGSMWGNRWLAASGGAQAFAELVATIGSTYDHNVGIYWFQGNCGDRMTDHTTYDPNPWVGTFEDGGSDFSLGTNRALTHHGDIESTCTSAMYNPGHCTGIGCGLVKCKEELQTLVNDHEKVILALSDGMENCRPYLDEVFPDGATSTYWSDAEAMRLYFVAVLTNTSWVEKLRNVVHRTSGIRTQDVKHILPGTTVGDAGTLIHQWFYGSFKNLFGYTSLNEIPDPTLKGGEWDTHPVTVNLGVDQVILYALFDEKDDGKWAFGVIPPGQKNAIYVDQADQYDDVVAFEGHAHKTLVVRLPLKIPGHEHRWAGSWQIVIGRQTGAAKRNYVVGAMAHQDVQSKLDLLVPHKPLQGDRATLRIALKDQHGKAIKNAVVKTKIHAPGEWPGHAVAMEVARNHKLVKALRRSKSKAARDTARTADRMLRELLERNALDDGTTKTITVRHVTNGVYRADVALTKAGNYNFEISVTGARPTSTAEIKTKIGAAKKNIKEIYPEPKVVASELAYLNKHAADQQAFQIAHREQVSVQFLPQASKSDVQGYFVDEKTIRLRVLPRNKTGTLLGPGWADGVQFSVPGVSHTWTGDDAADGIYSIDIPVTAEDPHVERTGRLIVATRLSVTHPRHGAVVPKEHQLPLDGFSVTVLGVKIPITVFALIGNARSKETHLVTCRHAARISPKNKVYIHDLKEAQKSGYDTCEWCLPLICNTNPTSMEAHKPFCAHVRRIAKANRLTVHYWTQAEKMGFDGCRYCLPEHHTR